MPQVTVYIKEKDLELWKKLKYKSNFIHEALHSVDIETYNKAAGERLEIKKMIMPHLNTMAKAEPENTSADFCKHNAVKGFCKKGCK